MKMKLRDIMDMNRKHISLLVLSEDEQKTPLANNRTEALLWWDSLDEAGKQRAYADFFSIPKPKNVGWKEMEFMHEQILLKVNSR